MPSNKKWHREQHTNTHTNTLTVRMRWNIKEVRDVLALTQIYKETKPHNKTKN